METIGASFSEYINQAISLAKTSTSVTEDNVFQEGNRDILPFLDKMVEELLLPGSGVDGMENLDELLNKAESGKSCLLLPEHYSNMDLSLISYLIRKEGGRGKAISDAIVAIAGMKLNEENPGVSALASAYTRLIIYPSRSHRGLDPAKDKDEIIRSNAINRAVMKTLQEIKVQGKLILVFPSGTRYRPGNPSTKRGVREVDSYVRSFDYMCPVALNGQILHVHHRDMMEDMVSQDLVRITAGKVISCSEYREKILCKNDKKQAVADAIMALLEEMHIQVEEKRKKIRG